MRAWARGNLGSLIEADPARIAADLTAEAAARRLDPNPESLRSWTQSTEALQRAAASLVEAIPGAGAWVYLLEFEIPRRRRRVDAIILAADVVILLEFKVGASTYDRAALWQAEQYALDLRDFHQGSHGHRIAPLVVATNAVTAREVAALPADSLVREVRMSNAADLATSIANAWHSAHRNGAPFLNTETWEDASYLPTPTIIEAARLLYERNNVRELNLAGASNLDTTVDAVLELVNQCRREHRRGIAFITGAPGSGKTLAGLQVVHTPELQGDRETAGVFLSGNMPLVNVISEALTSFTAQASGRRRADVAREVSTFIQHAYAFRNDYAEHPDRIPPEHVVLFDEAQRAWDAAQVRSWTNGATTRSEPQTLLDVMDRVPDWAVVIALIGSGQEINKGEAGVGEWGRALTETHPDWLVRAPTRMLPGAEPAPPGGRLFDVLPSNVDIRADERLQLHMNVRSPRAEQLNEWVDHLLELRTDEARIAFSRMGTDFPFVLTRDLDTAKAWLRDHSDEDMRAGLVANAEARRLRAWGLDTKVLRTEKAWAKWYLAERGDIRGSDQLEVPASNFDCQGLEIDWAGVCWGNDFVPSADGDGWRTRQFSGTRWTNAGGERARYILNGYRVILTRARRGQIIWVPRPRDASDPTLDPEDFDAIAEVLQAAGIPTIDT